MEACAKLKVPGGKLVSVKLSITDGYIEHAQVLGDFFLYPEERITAIESALSGISIKESEAEVAQVVAGVVASEKIQLIGITPEAIARVIAQAISNQDGAAQ